MPLLFIDFETRSEADLPSVGTYRYASDPSTEALCLAWATNEDPVHLWTPAYTDNLPVVVNLAITKEFTVVAHNCEFEREILRNVFKIDLPLDRFIDTAALSARMSLPRKLEEVAAFFGLDTAAKEEGKAAITALSKPRKPTKANPDKWWTPQTKPEAFEKLYARCRQDVDLTRAIFHKLLPLEPSERRIWQVTLEMNVRGVRVDRESIPLAREVLERDAAPQVAEFERMVGCKIKSYKRVAEALGMDDVRKPTVRKKLRDPATPPAVKRALQIYQALSKSSVAKLDAIEARVLEDGRVRGSFIYCGAERTARWSSNGVQFQNFARGLGLDTLIAFEALHAGCLELLFEGFPRPSPEPALTPTSTISNMLRGFILGPFLVGDLAQIEARGLNWLADEQQTLDLFRHHKDPYKQLASVIYNVPMEKVTKDQRFMGKQGVLGCGFGLGYKGFIRMLDEIYDIEISEEESKRVVNAYRASSPNVVKFWERLGSGFVHVVAAKRERVRVTRNIWMGTITISGEPYAYVELPSGRRLYYARPELDSSPIGKGPCVKYFGRDIRQGGIWTMVRTYGGKLAENVTQAISRDVIADALVKLDAAGFPLVMTVHDEIVAEQDGSKDLNLFKEIMESPPAWADGLPLEVDVFETTRYRK